MSSTGCQPVPLAYYRLAACSTVCDKLTFVNILLRT